MHDVFRVKLKLTFPVVQCHIPDIFSRLSQMSLAVVVIILYGDFFSSYMQSGDWKWLKNTLDTACCVNHLNFSAHDLSIRVYISLCLCVYTENKFSGFSS